MQQSIAAPVPGKNFSVGFGTGFYGGQQAIAFGAKAIVIENLQVGASFGTGFSSSGAMAASVGATYSF
jgi:autotransporter adhesin